MCWSLDWNLAMRTPPGLRRRCASAPERAPSSVILLVQIYKYPLESDLSKNLFPREEAPEDFAVVFFFFLQLDVCSLRRGRAAPQLQEQLSKRRQTPTSTALCRCWFTHTDLPGMISPLEYTPQYFRGPLCPLVLEFGV